MGFSFKGLAANALFSNSNANHEHDKKDVADIPAAIQGHTSMGNSHPDEKVGAPRSASSLSGTDSDEEVNKIDTTAERGIQAVQAVTHVWSRRDLILAYVL